MYSVHISEERIVTKTPAVNIPIKRQYTLSHGLFDPLQNSPPSIWKERLKKRLDKTNIK
jgi:hypothetical protein